MVGSSSLLSDIFYVFSSPLSRLNWRSLSVWGPGPPTPKVASPLLGSAHTPFPGYGTPGLVSSMVVHVLLPSPNIVTIYPYPFTTPIRQCTSLYTQHIPIPGSRNIQHLQFTTKHVPPQSILAPISTKYELSHSMLQYYNTIVPLHRYWTLLQDA
jgi:hypothetical protein